MATSSPSCAMLGESCTVTPAGDRHFPAGLCRWCGWYRCAMDCGRAVAEPAARCSECHPLACPCEDCRAFEALPDCDTCGVPVAVEEEETLPVEEKTQRLVYEPIGPAGLGDVRARRAA